METELKLALPTGALRKIEPHAIFAAAATHRREITTYFDTPELELRQSGLSLRIRRSGRSFRQSIKAEPADADKPQQFAEGAALRRGEWEWALKSNKPDLALLDGSEAALGMLKDAALRLEPLFFTEIDRTARTLRLDAGTEVEIVIDRGFVRAGEKSERVSELEIELKSGPAEPLYRLALELHGLAPVTVMVESKATRGYRLKTGRASEPCKAEKLELPAQIGLHNGFRRIIGSGIAHLLANLAVTVGGDAEGLHQARVALRRLQSVLVLFKPCLEPYAAARFSAECKRIGRIFGDARDIDVFLLETLADAERDGVDVSRLRPLAVARQEMAYAQVRQVIADPAFTGFVLALSAWIEGEAWAAPGKDGTEALNRPLADVAPSLLDRMARKSESLGGGKLGRRSPEALHDLRKSVKRLRYGVEFLGGLYDAKQVRRYRHACEDLQMRLGAINDMRTMVDFASVLSGKQTVDLVPDVGALAQWSESRSEHSRADLRLLWKEFVETAQFWR
jgi:inorganic triphosphatase YgiF